MANVHIFTDSCSDLGGDIRAKYNVDYLKMCTVYEGKETPADLDWPTYTPRELYDIMRAGNRILTTQVPPEEFKRRFTEALEAGEDIIYIGCCLPCSSSVNTGAVIAEELLKQYPGRKIFCIDSVNACMGEGLVALKAAELRNAGKSIEEIVEEVNKLKLYVQMFITVGSLDMLKKSGRVSGSKAFFGNLLGVKPVIISDRRGVNVPVAKAKGRQKSLDMVVDMMKENVVDPQNQTVFVAHADCPEEAEYLRQAAIERIGFRDAYVNYIGPIIGASIGPGAIGLFAFGKEMTFDYLATQGK